MGQEHANDDLANGVAVNLFSGLPDRSEMLDRETGLVGSTTGCLVSEEIAGHVAGYREAIASYIAENGPPSNSRKPWEDILFNLDEHFRERSEALAPIFLKVGEPGIVSPDGRTVVSVTHQEASDSSLDPWLGGQVKHSSGEAVEWYATWTQSGAEGLRCYWGPEGSDVLIVRGATNDRYGPPGSVLTGALDLRSGQWLRYEITDPSDDSILVEILWWSCVRNSRLVIKTPDMVYEPQPGARAEALIVTISAEEARSIRHILDESGYFEWRQEPLAGGFVGVRLEITTPDLQHEVEAGDTEGERYGRVQQLVWELIYLVEEKVGRAEEEARANRSP